MFLPFLVTSSMFVFVLKNQQNTYSVNVLSLKDLPEIHPFGCFESRLRAKICVKEADEFVSRNIMEEGVWEEENVFYALKAMKFHDDAVFVDAGSNIGVYSVLVAALGREVVAVDAMADNLAYIRKSLETGDKQHLVTLVHNAISDNHETMYPVRFNENSDPVKNPGSLRVAGHDELNNMANSEPLGPGVQSVTLSDIFNTISARTIVLKMDIQGQECKALLAPGVFTSGHFIPYIFVEWDLISIGRKFCPNLEELIQLLKSQGYSAINLSPPGYLSDVCLHKGMKDVVWMHKDARPLWDEDMVFYQCEPYSELINV